MMTTRQVPSVPQAPAPPAAPGINVVTTANLTSRDVAALRARADALSDQLTSATGRRAEVQRALRNATGVDRAGLEQRIGVLDTRIARLESDIDQNSAQLASLAANRVTSTQPSFPGFNNSSRGPRMNGNMVPIVIVFTIFVLSPIALSISRMFWRRGSLPKQLPQAADNTQRLERMEQAIDAIAIEMERVSEGQRFVTRLMSERQGAVLPALPIGLAAGEKLRAP